MAITVNTQVNASGVLNHATGQIVTDAASAAAATITLGFAPRVVRFHNITDRISDEYFEGMQEGALARSIRGILTKLDADGGVTDVDYASLCNPAGMTVAEMVTAVTAMNAKLDADGGVTDTTYTSLWTPASTVAGLQTAIAGITAKLDLDGGVTGTDFASLWNPATTMSLHTVANGTRTLEGTNGIAVSGNTFTLTATTMVAAKQFMWEAIG